MTYTQIISALRKAGFRVQGKETTDGARKAWLAMTVALTRSECLDRAEKAVGALHGVGYRIEYQEAEEYGYDSPALFVAVTKGRPRGMEYRMGIDC
jgi:hypothetical protein